MVVHDSKIIIVGGGVFGLSTALWLARDGYQDITIFDRCAFDKNFYNPADGCDGASADINKVFRMAYGDQQSYQNLAIEVRSIWLEWNKQVAQSSPVQLPKGLAPDDKLLYECGNCYVAEGPELHQHFKNSLATMEREAPEYRKTKFIKNDPAEEERLRKISPKWVEKLHVTDKANNGDTNGFLDIQGGLTVADKACVYAKHLCEKAGVKFVLGAPQGQFKAFIEKETVSGDKKIVGIKTHDGLRHEADLVIVAAGGWSASIIPEAHQAVEATAGRVLFVDIPEDRQDLRRKFHPDNWPVWSVRSGSGDNYCMGNFFPVNKHGRMKFGFRAKKFTNFEPHPTEPNLRVSTPRTKYTDTPINTVPLHGLQHTKRVVYEALPELKEFGFTDGKLCWYTDSIDNNYVIDYVPGYSDSLFICTGGSGHGFKFLPILGRHVKNQLERVPDHFTPLWKWRTTEAGKPNNGLSEGEHGPRNLQLSEMASPDDYLSSSNDSGIDLDGLQIRPQENGSHE